MPTVFFVRDGSGDHKTSQGHEVSPVQARSAVAKHSVRFFANGPTINDGVASALAPYKHVVIEIGQNETSKDFPKAGFYYVVGLSPSEAQKIFGVSNP